MFFHKKNKEITLHCYTSNSIAFDFFKIKEAKHFWPDWWKKLPKSISHNEIPYGTMKTCDGFLRLYKNSFIIPLWSDFDLQLKYQEDKIINYKWLFADGMSNAVSHPPNQWEGFLPHALHLKLVNPWMFSCEEEVNFLLMAPFWNHKETTNFQICPGVVEFKYQSHLHLNSFIIPDSGDSHYQFSAGTPIAQVIPLTERPLKFEFHYSTKEEIHKYHHKTYGVSFFINNYQRLKSLLKEKDQKCPLHKR